MYFVDGFSAFSDFDVTDASVFVSFLHSTPLSAASEFFFLFAEFLFDFVVDDGGLRQEPVVVETPQRQFPSHRVFQLYYLQHEGKRIG